MKKTASKKDNKNSSFEEVLKKAENFCAYQERCTDDVYSKLKALKLDEKDKSKIIKHLLENNFINDERYALSFARGKFRIKKWGKLKIKAALKAKKISLQLIEKALCSIDEKEYRQTIQLMVQQQKKKNFPPSSEFIYKLKRHLYAKGFEVDDITGLDD